MSFDDTISSKGRSRGRGHRFPQQSLNDHRSLIATVDQTVEQMTQYAIARMVQEQSPQFKSVEDEDDDLCKVCERPCTNLICQACGNIWKGRKRISCPSHPNTVFLMDTSNCVNCHSDNIKEIRL